MKVSKCPFINFLNINELLEMFATLVLNNSISFGTARHTDPAKQGGAHQA